MKDYRNITREYLERHGPHKAAVALVRDAAKDSELSDALLLLGAQQMVRNATTNGRSLSALESPSRMLLPSEAGRNARDQYMDSYRLYGGQITLAAATPRELADSARQHDAQANGHNRAAAFEREIAKRIHNGKTVREVFKDDTIRNIAKEFKL